MLNSGSRVGNVNIMKRQEFALCLCGTFLQAFLPFRSTPNIYVVLFTLSIFCQHQSDSVKIWRGAVRFQLERHTANSEQNTNRRQYVLCFRRKQWLFDLSRNPEPTMFCLKSGRNLKMFFCSWSSGSCICILSVTCVQAMC